MSFLNYFLLADAQSATGVPWRKFCPALLNQLKEVKKEKRDRERKILKEYLKDKRGALALQSFRLTVCKPPTINQKPLLSFWVPSQADGLSGRTSDFSSNPTQCFYF